MVSEALQAEGGVETKVDLSGLHNVSQKTSSREASGIGEGLPETVPPDPPGPEMVQEKKTPVENQEMIFAEALSLNSVTTDG